MTKTMMKNVTINAEWAEALVIKELNTIADNNKLNLKDKGDKQNV